MSATLESRLRSLDRRVGAVGLLLTGAAVLGGVWLLGDWAAKRVEDFAGERAALTVAREDLELDLAERQALSDVTNRDLKRAKESAASLSKSRKALFEGGLAVSEEKRLLEKQLEIMSLWIRLDEENDKIHLVRGDVIAETLSLGEARLRAVGGETRPLPKTAVVISKERFASPERPKSDAVAGQLQWEPPQVGASTRASALGEHVLFTKEGVIIHGKPLKDAEHEAYPHLCLSLPPAVARRIYSQSYIGTKFLFAPGPTP